VRTRASRVVAIGVHVARDVQHDVSGGARRDARCLTAARIETACVEDVAVKMKTGRKFRPVRVSRALGGNQSSSFSISSA
jgi:hypothetical protein